MCEKKREGGREREGDKRKRDRDRGLHSASLYISLFFLLSTRRALIFSAYLSVYLFLLSASHTLALLLSLSHALWGFGKTSVIKFR